MKIQGLFLIFLAAASAADVVEPDQTGDYLVKLPSTPGQPGERYTRLPMPSQIGDHHVKNYASRENLIETAPGKTRWANEWEKCELRSNSQRFMDVTNATLAARSLDQVVFPKELVSHRLSRKSWRTISKKRVEGRIRDLAAFTTRYHKTKSGRQAADYVFSTIETMLRQSTVTSHVRVRKFQHPWKQYSVIASIQGKSKNKIIISSHLDSINLEAPDFMPAPGADSGGSGTSVALEVFQNLISWRQFAQIKPVTTIEFHWYSGEEGGLLGSQAVLESYRQEGSVIKAMLNLDMLGYVTGTEKGGRFKTLAVVEDYVHPDLTRFVRLLVDRYTRDVPWIMTKCGYACSSHVSAYKLGIPSAFVMESAYEESNPYIGSAEDTIDRLDMDHIMHFVWLARGFVHQLALWDFDEEQRKRPVKNWSVPWNPWAAWNAGPH